MEHEPNQVDKIVGANLSQRRAAAGFTQKSFGEACARPISAQQISEYERGMNQINSTRLVEFAQVLKCPVSELFDGVAELLPPKSTATRGDAALMRDYQQLTDPLQDSVRILVHAMVKEITLNSRPVYE